jgi:cytosol alanyl aminopeptidase
MYRTVALPVVCLAGLIAVSSAVHAQLTVQPPAPSFRLNDIAKPVKYEARLAIDPRQAQFEGELRLTFEVKQTTPTIWLNATNLTVSSIEVKQGARTYQARVRKLNDDIIALDAWAEVPPVVPPPTTVAEQPATTSSPATVPPSPAEQLPMPPRAPAAPVWEASHFDPGVVVANIRYRGELEPLATRGLFRQQEAGEWYVVSQFEALHARRAFPSFDEPGWKTPWQLTLDTPKDLVAVSNTPEAASYDVPDRPGWKRRAFAWTKPLPSYLIALAVGPFDVVDGGRAGKKQTPLRYLAPKGRGGELTWVKESTPKILELMENYFGSPYPFEKLDSVTIPQTINFGAMENVGLITYNANLMLAKPHEETTAFKRRYASIAGHEIAHQWFGNLVTPSWWDDIWLNEAFATWMAEKILYQFRPEWNDGWNRAFARAQAINSDKLVSTRKVKNPVVTKGDVGAAFDRITYQKGGQVLSMFEAWLTPEQFQQGVRNYMQRHAFGNATSQDFFRAIGEAAGKRDDALKAFTAFIEQPGVPLVDVSLQCVGKNIGLKVSQQRLRPAGSQAADMEWTTPACFKFGQGAKVETRCMEISNASKIVPLPTAKTCPEWVLGNANGAGYYVTRYDAALEKKNSANVSRLPEQEAVALLSDAALRAESGLMPIDAALEWANANIRHPSAVVKRQAVTLLAAQRDAWLNPKQQRRKQEIVKREMLPVAQKLGWQEKPNEDDRTRSLRATLLPIVADLGQRDAESLRLEARTLAMKWLDDRTAVSPSMVEPVLQTAARFADRATHERLVSTFTTAGDRRELRYLGNALALTRDAQFRRATYDLMVAKEGTQDKVRGPDVLLFLSDALEDEHNRAAAFTFVRGNFDALNAKLPQDTAGQTMSSLSRLCTKDDRAMFVNFFKDRAPKFLGGQRRYEQALERIDLCIAARDMARPVASVVTTR